MRSTTKFDAKTIFTPKRQETHEIKHEILKTEIEFSCKPFYSAWMALRKLGGNMEKNQKGNCDYFSQFFFSRNSRNSSLQFRLFSCKSKKKINCEINSEL